MANSYNNQFQLTREKKVMSVFAKVAIGGTGAPTLSAANSKGIVSVTRNSAGAYTFVLGTSSSQKDVYVKLLGMKTVFNSGSSAPASPITYIITDSSATFGTSSIKIGCLDYAGAAVDPASGEIMYVEFKFGDSSSG